MTVELPKLEDFSKDDVLEPDALPEAPGPEEAENVAVDPQPLPFPALDQNNVVCFFEPVFSVQKMEVIGLRAVRRLVDPADPGRLFEPRELARPGEELDFHRRLILDRLARQKSMEAFYPLQARTPRLLMFLDVESSLLDETVGGSGHLLQQVEEWSMDPRRVVVQLSLREEGDLFPLRRFVEAHRNYGFLTSVKDVRASSPHLEALLRLNPDMVQVEDSLVRGLAKRKEKRTAFGGILKMAHSLGILVVAGGIESEEDALVALEYGTDLVQGGYFSKSYKKKPVFTLNRKSRMQFLASRFKRRLTERANRDLGLKSRCTAMTASLTAALPNKPALELEGEFPSLFRGFPGLECLYLLDGEGVQVSETICSWRIPERKGILFHPAPKGTDHSFREFYYALLSPPVRRHYVTEPYLSMNSGNLCVTAATVVGDPSADFHILCADLNVTGI